LEEGKLIPLQIIVARYEESLDWLGRLQPVMAQGKVAVRVYNKGPHMQLVPIQTNLRNLPNVGREADTFLTFIREEVERELQSPGCEGRADHIALVQGNPFDHCPQMLERSCYFRDYQHCDVAVPLGPVCFSDEFGKPHHPGLMLRPAYEALFEREWPGTIAFSGGAQYVFPRSKLFDRPLSFWERFHAMVLDERFGPWIAERLWWEALGVRMERTT
jgi:hypothetical protein